jgi:NAD(P)H-quinone oxidoreductase subunit 5
MNAISVWGLILGVSPAFWMLSLFVLTKWTACSIKGLKSSFQWASLLAITSLFLSLLLGAHRAYYPGLFITTPVILSMGVLVQFLGLVIQKFSARYLDREVGERAYIGHLSLVLGAVQVLLMADHWVLLILIWAFIGIPLQSLLCFYPDRPFALLAAHKKWMIDRLADLMLVLSAALAWRDVGSGSISLFLSHLSGTGLSIPLEISGVCLVLGVVFRMALLPVHGWLIQVMEAPTPVSALLHAGVVNLGGFMMIRFSPLLNAAKVAPIVLGAFGLVTVVFASMVMMTRISIKVRLAWSTVAQMGFLLLECALGLYTFAFIHLIGHSLYKAHAFLFASSVVKQTRLQVLRGAFSMARMSLILAPFLSIVIVFFWMERMDSSAFPLWLSVTLGLAWAPILWLSHQVSLWRVLLQILMLSVFTVVLITLHHLPLGIHNDPRFGLGVVTMLAMFLLYLFQVNWSLNPKGLGGWHRWSYAGFFLDESFTRLALILFPEKRTLNRLKSFGFEMKSGRVN